MSDQTQKNALQNDSVQLKRQIKKLTAENKKLRAEQKNIKQLVDKNEALLEQLREVNQQLVFSTLNAFAEKDMANLKYDELEQHSQRDGLTGLANRAFMLECISLAVNATKRHNKNFALLFIDLDQFKPVNDNLGHAMGDKILKDVANRLSAVMRESDTLSRYGGDEFIALLNEISCLDDVEKVAKKMITVLAQPSVMNEHTIPLAASIGVAIYPQDGTDAKTLIEHADHAMYHVKKRGGNGFTTS
ncbi:hypothetical protein tinsulaeT_28100 [Thalassotalea insulae]|uniref:GGDEF domain-containing protein n=1 Tax=Thalassotalea insulae TaxID=2056778 RepID=A0ABQ6GU49_9GAMM|nr:diguanylate cyclase [Thalassotalea insulae]GLX79470.1 hypothetical protein tinsulaeT_28100 [Thalassotalea insulae]